MANPMLRIGNKNSSSWSLRPWLLMNVNGIPFDEVRIALYQQPSTAAIQAHAYVETIPLPALREWISAACAETEVLPQFER